MPAKYKRSVLTADQQRHVRANMMNSASKIANQLGEYITSGAIKVAGNDIQLTNERLAAYRLILDRTIPTLSASEITHKSGLETMDSTKLVSRLAELVKLRPELASRLQEALGHRVLEHQPEDQINPPRPLRKTHQETQEAKEPVVAVPN